MNSRKIGVALSLFQDLCIQIFENLWVYLPDRDEQAVYAEFWQLKKMFL